MREHDTEGELDRRLAKTRLLVLDVDGVLTNGRVTYLGGELEAQTFNVHDGACFTWLRDAGVEIAWITGRGSEATRRRAEELGVVELHMQARPKGAVLDRLQERLEVGCDETASMGDDLHDLTVAKRSAVFACPADARPEVLARADIVTAAVGGAGAVREFAERILRAKGVWDRRVAEYDDET